ncbi:MAG: NhaP-type Na+/H+ or K+/H+ antiporter [Psychromonas sp.]|jgi:NhaP-type Na+/H+ or K+/H+ antiporter|uniref:cation:proton antiporter n=1 Tax=Psychromonas sp. TaxID=1884585 RepID=UPI0039E400C2
MTALIFAAIALVSVAAQWLAWSLKVPAILFLLLTGLLLGPGLGLLNPDKLLGDLLFPVISLSVAIILFEGALTLHFKELKGIGKIVRNLCSIGILVTFVVVSSAAYWLLDLDWRVAAVIGAVLVVTGPTVIAPILNTMKPVKEIDSILRWEGIVIDPIGALFAVLVFGAVTSTNQGDAVFSTLLALLQMLSAGLLLGIFAGWFSALVIRREWLPYELHKFAILAMVLMIHSIANLASHESGLLAVTIYGIWLANQDDLDLASILAFKEDLSKILISSLFILLAARLDWGSVLLLGPMVFLFLLVILFIARPLCIITSTMGSTISYKSKILLSWIAPRGIVAAAVGSVFALSLTEAGVKDADKIVPLIFTVIIVTVVLQSLTATPLAQWLGLRKPAPSTLLFIGANHVARGIAVGLKELGFSVLVSDPAWENCHLARMAGLACYYGNPQSEHAERFVPLADLRMVLALSPNRHYNALAVHHFAHLLDEKTVFSLHSGENHNKRNKVSSTFRSRQVLFRRDVTFTKLSSLLTKAGKVKATKLGDSFLWQAYLQANKNAVPLFVISTAGKLKPFEIGDDYQPSAGETIVAVHPSANAEVKNSVAAAQLQPAVSYKQAN